MPHTPGDPRSSASSMNLTLDDDRGNSSCLPPPMDPALSIFISIIHVAICVVGLLGNTLVIYVVLRFSKMQTVTNIYIVNLAIADECFLIGIPFLVTTSILKSWTFGGYMCRIYMTTIGINQFTSSTFITIMSADRYIAICHPISSPKLRTPFISKIVAAAAWTISAIMILPIILYSDAVKDPSEPDHYTCNIIWPTSNETDLPVMKPLNTFTIYSFILTFAIPLTLTFICYVLVIRKLQTVGPKNKSKEKKRSHRKVTKLILTVITVYVFCWLPYWITQLVLIFQSPEIEEDKSCPKQQQGVSLFLLCHMIANLLSNANSAMNPVLYAFLSDNFKKSFVKACICAANKDVNAALQMENSVFPKKLGRSESERQKEYYQTNTTVCTLNDDRNNEDSQLVSRNDVAVASRSTTTELQFEKPQTEPQSREELIKNGLQPTAV